MSALDARVLLVETGADIVESEDAFSIEHVVRDAFDVADDLEPRIVAKIVDPRARLAGEARDGENDPPQALALIDALQHLDFPVDRARLLLLDLDARLVREEGEEQNREDHEEQDEHRRQPNGGGSPQLGELTHGSCIRRRGWCAAAGGRAPCRSCRAAATCGRRSRWSGDRSDSPIHSRAAWCA